MSEPIAVGLAGSGPWAAGVHAPVLAAGPETYLAGVWSRSTPHAEALAAAHGARAFARYEELLDACEAVAICVAPEAQPALAVAAARRGKALLLEKPLALDVAGARAIAGAVEEHAVPSLMGLTYRYAPNVRAFIATARSFDAAGGRAAFFSGAFLGGSPYAGSAWRRDHGLVLDVGPHILDLVDAALGAVVTVAAHGDRHRWVGIAAQHARGAWSDVSLCCRAAIESRTEVELLGPGGSLLVDARAHDRREMFATLRADLATIVREGRTDHECNAARGLHLQILLDAAERALDSGTATIVTA